MLYFLCLFVFAAPLYSMQGYFDTRYHFNKGIGFDGGYATFDLFALQPFNNSLAVLGNVRGHLLNEGEAALNAGLGFRYGGGPCLFGAHVFYDYRKVCSQGLNQISAGFEALGSCYDVRIDGYYPLHQKFLFTNEVQFKHFLDHRVFISRCYKKPLPLLTAEGAFRFSCAKISGVAALSPYYLFESKCHGITFGGAPGVQARLKLCFSQWFYAEGRLSHDRIYKTIAQGVLGVSIPFGGKRSPVSDCRALRAIERQEIIPIQRKYCKSVFTNPSTSEAYHFIFVNEDLFGTGSGTYEDPYTRLSIASLYSKPNDIFLVTPTEKGLEEIVLQEGQKLWSTSLDQDLEGLTIPGATAFQKRYVPILAFVTLTKNNEVSGFHFVGTGNETGIYADNLKGRHVISHCVFENLKKGIDLTVLEKASVTLSKNVFDLIGEEAVLLTNLGEVSLEGKNNLFSNAAFGFSFDLSGNTDLILSDNEMGSISGNGILLSQASGSLNANMFRNRIEANERTVLLNYQEGIVSMRDNILTSMTERVLDINTSGGSLELLDNRLYGVPGFEVLYLHRRLGASTLIADIYHNHFIDGAESTVSNWGDPSLLKLKVVDPSDGEESLESQNFGEISASNVEYVLRH